MPPEPAADRQGPLGPLEDNQFVAGLRRNRIRAPLVFEGAMNGQSFLTYLETILVPSLSAGDNVVMDKSPGPQGRRRAKADRSRQRNTDLPSNAILPT
jgi:hypothetical protein